MNALAILLSLVMLFTSMGGASDEYQQVTVSDLVVDVYDSSEVVSHLDLTGLALGLGAGGTEDGQGGAITLDLTCNGQAQQALVQVADGEAIMTMDGLPFALTVPMPSEEEVNMFLQEYMDMSLSELTMLFQQETMPAMTTEDYIATIVALLNSAPCQERKIYNSQETFLDGQLTMNVSRVDFSMTAEEAQSFLMDMGEFAEMAMSEMNGEFTLEGVENLGPVKGTLCHSDNLFSLTGTAEVMLEGEYVPVPFDVFFYTDGNNSDFHMILTLDENNKIDFTGAIRMNEGVGTTDIVFSMTEEGETMELIKIDADFSDTETNSDLEMVIYVMGESFLDMDMHYVSTPTQLYVDSVMSIDADTMSVTMACTYDAEVTEANGTKTLTGPLELDLSYSEYGSGSTVTLDCGLTLHTAPLEGYMTPLPESIRRVAVSDMTDEEMGQLQGAAVAFVAPVFTIPGISDLMVEEGVFSSAGDLGIEPEPDYPEESESSGSLFGAIQEDIQD